MSDKPVHVMPNDGVDIIEHETKASCPCNPKRVFEIDFKVPMYVHNMLKENPQ